MKSRDGKSQRREKKKEDQRRESLRRKKIQARKKVGKSRNSVVFQWFLAPEGWKVGSAKAAGAEPCGQMSDEKLHAGVVRSTCRSQNVQSTSCSDHLWKLRCQKSARRCGAKHISQSKRTKHTSSGPPYHFWNLRCRKSARCCGAKHTSKSKVQKTEGYGALFDVQISFFGAVAGDCAPCQKWAKREGFVVVSTTTCTHYTTLHYTTPHHTRLHYTTLHYTTLHHTTLHYTSLHYTTLHHTTLHFTTLHYTTLHFTKLHYTTYTTLHYTTLH